MPSYKPVTAALRVLEVLEAVNRLRAARVGQIYEITKINRPTIVRMLETLEHAEFVYRDPGTSTFLPTAKTFQLSRGYDLVTELSAVTLPILVELQARLHWPSDVAVFDGSAMVIVATTRRSGQLFADLRPGYRASVFATSLGRAFFAWASQSDRERAIVAARKSSLTSATSKDEESELRRLMEDVRASGFSTMAHGSGVASFGVPILIEDVAIGAVNVLYLPGAISPEEAEKSLLPGLREAALALVSKIASRQAAIRPGPPSESAATPGYGQD